MVGEHCSHHRLEHLPAQTNEVLDTPLVGPRHVLIDPRTPKVQQWHLLRRGRRFESDLDVVDARRYRHAD